MIATKKYIHALQEKYDFGCFYTHSTPTKAFIEWFNDHSEKVVSGDWKLRDFDLDFVLDYFKKDLEAMYD